MCVFCVWVYFYSPISPPLSQAFPMDCIAFTLLVFYYVLSTAAGVVHGGVRFCFMKVWGERETEREREREREGERKRETDRERERERERWRD